MGQSHSVKAATNEKEYPNIVEVAVGSGPLDAELGRRVMLFHKSRHIEPRHGRRVSRNDELYFRWCFSDLATACDFLEQFRGQLIEHHLVAGPPH